MTFAISSVVPAAEGTVKIKEDRNKNYNMKLDVIRLAESNRLTPPKAMYIVWMETEQNGIMNIGQLKVTDKIGSGAKLHKIALNTVTTFKPINIFITAEDEANLTYPVGQTILTTSTAK